MTQARKPRIALEPNALQALKIWAALEYEDPSVLAGKIILDHIPSEVKDLITPMPSEGKGRGTSKDIKKPSKSKAASKDLPAKITHKHHGDKSPLPDEMKAKILALWDDGKSGKSQRAIAQEMGLSQSTVSKVIAKKEHPSP